MRLLAHEAHLETLRRTKKKIVLDSQNEYVLFSKSNKCSSKLSGSVIKLFPYYRADLSRQQFSIDLMTDRGKYCEDELI